MYRRSWLSRELEASILAGKRSASRTEICADRGKGRAVVTCFRGASKAVTSAQGRLTRAYCCGRDGPGGLPKREGCQDRPQLESGLRRRGRICVTLPNSAMRAGSSLPDNDTERDAGNAWSIHSFTYPQIEKWTSLGYV